MARRTYRQGDHLVSCDYSGQTFYASECKMTWDGKLVHKKYWEPRHPQDFVRAKADDQSVPNARPPGDDEFIGITYFTGYLLQENGSPLIQEDGKEIIW